MSDPVLRELTDALGADAVIPGEEADPRYHNDWAGLEPVVPKAVVRPRSVEEVAVALAVCHRHLQPVVPQGGRTGLAGAARPSPGAVVLSVERLNRVLDVDPAGATMVVEAGVVLERAQEAAREAGMFLPVDLGARGSCQVGGVLATNAGGNRVIRFGMARENCLGLEAVLADGTRVGRLNRLLKNNAGVDLERLFVGSEGILGLITRAVLRLQPEPRTTMAAFCGLVDFDAVVTLLRRARARLGGLLTAFEAMWPEYYDLMTARVAHLRPPLAGRHGMYVLIEAQGFDPEGDPPRFQRLLEEMVEEGLLEDAAVARSEADVRAFWAVRDAVAEFPLIFGRDRHVNFDLGLAPERTQPFVDALRRELPRRFPGITAVYFGHLGDGNIHVVTGLPEGVDKRAVEAVVYGTVGAFDGTISAEHGIGTIKKPWLHLVRGAADVAAMKRLKRALDPNGILNPGKLLDA